MLTTEATVSQFSFSFLFSIFLFSRHPSIPPPSISENSNEVVKLLDPQNFCSYPSLVPGKFGENIKFASFLGLGRLCVFLSGPEA